MPDQPESSQFTPTDEALGMLHDAIDWVRFADIDAARRILLRFAVTGEYGHLPLTAEQAATFVVDAISEQIHARGIAEGLRQAEAKARDLSDGYHELELAHGRWYSLDELGIRVMLDRRPTLTVLRWKALEEPAERPDRDPLTDDRVARRLGLVDAEGRTLCRCLAGDPACPHRPAEQPAPAPVLEDPEVNGLATHLCSFDRCFPAPCADHLSTAGAALKWMANRRAQAAEQPPAVEHALGCMCGTNDAGQRFNDPICRRTT